jgi:uncharacterized RDD family membrane protein YckC
LTAAAYPTWEVWRPVEYDESQTFSCMGGFDGNASPFLPLRGDLGTLTELATTWAVPVLVVLAALGRWHSARAGRQAAAVLTLIAVVRPLTPWYIGDSPCDGPLDLFSVDWFKAVISSWGLWELALLVAAVLVLLATHALGPAEEPVTAAPSRPWGQAALVLLIDYLVVTLVLVGMVGKYRLDSGLLQWLSSDDIMREPALLLFYPALVAYILLRKRLAARPMAVARPIAVAGLPWRRATSPWTVLIGAAALTAAAVPTLQSWGSGPVRWGVFMGNTYELSMITSFLTTMRGDADEVVRFAVTWGAPVLAVLACFGLRNSAVARRTAGVLVVLALAGSLVTIPFDVEVCCLYPGNMDESVEDVHNGWLTASLLVAAVLVLVASRWMGSEGESARAASLPRRTGALVIDYLVAVAFLIAALRLDVIDLYLLPLDHGLLNGVRLDELAANPKWLLIALLIFLYALSGRTLGKLLMRVRVVSGTTGRWPGWGRSAVRALVFPLLVLVPVIGVALLVLDGMWAVADPAGRSLHDRLSGTIVVDKSVCGTA